MPFGTSVQQTREIFFARIVRKRRHNGADRRLYSARTVVGSAPCRLVRFDLSAAVGLHQPDMAVRQTANRSGSCAKMRLRIHRSSLRPRYPPNRTLLNGRGVRASGNGPARQMARGAARLGAQQAEQAQKRPSWKFGDVHLISYFPLRLLSPVRSSPALPPRPLR
jgi:hypothetical protein